MSAEQHVIYSEYEVHPVSFAWGGSQYDRFEWIVPNGTLASERQFVTEDEAHADARAAFGLG